MRMIDADAAIAYLENHKKVAKENGFILVADEDAIIKFLKEKCPTLPPPTEPLTLEELRQMNGEPVWVEDVKHWALIDIEKGGQWDGVPFAIWAENGAKFTYNVESRGLHCYRRPPEGET